jgi:HPr kinase/phosphorylase
MGMSGGTPPPISAPEPTAVVSAGTLASDLEPTVRLRRLAGQAGLERPIRHPRVQKSGLALAGHFYGVVPARVQILGETELSYLDSLDADGRTVSARGFFSLGLSSVIVTSNQEPPRPFIAAAEATSTPLFLSSGRSSRTINAVHAVLDDRLAPQTTLHGVLVDVFGVGLLLLGKSGIGKSECALELVLRGHRLVADDVVQCDWRPPGVVFGAPANLLRHHIEARGLGVLNVKALFGVTAVRDRKSIDVVVRLVEWDKSEEYDRLGVEDTYHTILGTPIRELTVPVRPGRDMGSILEVAARNELLRRAGEHSAREFLGRLEGHLLEGARTAPARHDDPSRREPARLTLPTAEGQEPAKGTPPDPASSGPGSFGEGHEPEDDDSRGPPSFPSERANESSAWIPAVRPERTGEPGGPDKGGT